MINIKPFIVEKLKTISSNVTDSYPQKWSEFPIIQFVEEDNKIHLKIDDKEKLSYIRYKIDIWDKKSTSKMTLDIDREITLLGLERIQCLDIPEPNGLKHKVIRYEGIIDVDTLRVYNK